MLPIATVSAQGPNFRAIFNAYTGRFDFVLNVPNATPSANSIIVYTGTYPLTWLELPSCPSGALGYDIGVPEFTCNPISIGSFADNETPAGVIDGANATFTLANVPDPSESLILTKNGQVLYVGLGYTLSGSTITYEPAYIPVVGDEHRATQYRY